MEEKDKNAGKAQMRKNNSLIGVILSGNGCHTIKTKLKFYGIFIRPFPRANTSILPPSL